MRRDHEVALHEALDQLFLHGTTAILWQSLYLWYNAERISKRVYADIIEKWQAVCEGYGYIKDVPELQQLVYSDTWLVIRRGLFKEEELIALADLS
jgi:hypothetical protein